jgi:hypothetical protein
MRIPSYKDRLEITHETCIWKGSGPRVVPSRPAGHAFRDWRDTVCYHSAVSSLCIQHQQKHAGFLLAYGIQNRLCRL